MKTSGLLARAAAGAAGGVLLLGVAGAALAAEVGTDEVDVSVAIEEEEPVGALTMTVAADATTLTEVESTEEGVRQFDGTLPTVTVTDDREDVPADTYWYVVGQASDFVNEEGGIIPAEHLGWAPAVLTEGDGEVTAGDQVDTVLDEGPNNVGLVGEELLALNLSSADARPIGTWDANAALFLKTPSDIEGGNYTSKITLTLWEETF
ncbi:hypothetical protein [Microbacterium kunmingense]|jgi:hypothetical protein|uniref:hypothetical protein n=1 Tax=Microbacterium kunmingense TaxID=2915939 RepID=UPI003D71D7E4